MSNNLKFDKNLHHFEDQLFTLEYMKTCERINSISKLLYFYNYGIGISSINPELNDFKNINIKLSKVLRGYNDKNVVNYLTIRIINYCFSAFVHNRCSLSYSYYKANQYIVKSDKEQLRKFLSDYSYDRHITVNRRVERFLRIVLSDTSSIITKLRFTWLSFYEWQRQATKMTKR